MLCHKAVDLYFSLTKLLIGVFTEISLHFGSMNMNLAEHEHKSEVDSVVST